MEGKKTFLIPELTIVIFDGEDIITNSMDYIGGEGGEYSDPE